MIQPISVKARSWMGCYASILDLKTMRDLQYGTDSAALNPIYFMAELRFDCPSCKQSIACDELWGGHLIQCPSCNSEITVPQKPAQPAAGARCPAGSDSAGSTVQVVRRPLAASTSNGIARPLCAACDCFPKATRAKSKRQRPAGQNRHCGRRFGRPGRRRIFRLALHQRFDEQGFQKGC